MTDGEEQLLVDLTDWMQTQIAIQDAEDELQKVENMDPSEKATLVRLAERSHIEPLKLSEPQQELIRIYKDAIDGGAFRRGRLTTLQELSQWLEQRYEPR
jgi:hypothetical protein